MLVNPQPAEWRSRTVFVTGHTGFKGGWLSLWLNRLGARVHGFALEPPTEPNLFEAAGLSAALAGDHRGDLADLLALSHAMRSAAPEVVFHLAAQPLVRESYRDPLGTLRTNIIGTAHVLEAVRMTPSVRAVVLVTTDKVYVNREWPYPYREVDPLGGRDPYSASKAAAEIVAESYRASFFDAPDAHPALVATARAGNVIGGGDWASDRLVPDCFRAFERGDPVRLRFPDSVRPWQHVLEPTSGYLRLAESLLGATGRAAARSWNFGPAASGDATVGQVASMTAGLWGPEARVERDQTARQPHEASTLRLDVTQARVALGWSPRWTLEQSLSCTVDWQKAWGRGDDMKVVTLGQIERYEADAQ